MDILKVTFVIIGTIIGAGFASGQEIYLFFNRYGNMGLFGMIISCMLTGLIIYAVFNILKNAQIHNYSEFLDNINSNKAINKITQIMIQIFLLISFYIMVAGVCAYFKQEFKISIYISAIIMAVLCYIIFINNTKALISINVILIPFLIIFILYIGIKNISFDMEFFKNNIWVENSFGWIFSSILYASYNSIILIPILIQMKNYIDKHSKIKVISVFCGLILLGIGICLFSLLSNGDKNIATLELPMMQVIKQFGSIYLAIYGIIIVIAIFTSAISAGYGFLKNITCTNKKNKKIAAIMCISSVIISPLGFSNLVKILYPFFGVLGLIQVFQIFKFHIKQNKIIDK